MAGSDAMARRRQWGSGEVLPPGSTGNPGRSWAIRWREGGRRRFKAGFTDKPLADRALARIKGEIAVELAGLPPDPRGFPTLEVLAQDWIARREHTHRSWGDDRGRWELHLRPFFGRMRASEVGTAEIRGFVERQLRAKMNRGTLGLCIRCLSTFFSDLCERPRETGATANPVSAIPKSLRRLYRPDHDPRFTQYLRRLADVRNLYQALPERVAVAYAVGVVAGLRTGEVLALEWDHLDLDEPRLDVRWQIQNGARGPLKDDEARILRGLWLAPLVPVLKAWRLKSGGRGLVFPPLTGRRRSASFMTPQELYRDLHPTLRELGLPALEPKPWYQATRHTFATHWVRAGHPIAGLAAAMGHSTTWVTERYAHHHEASARGPAEDEDPWTLDLLRAPAPVAQLPGRAAPEDGQRTARRPRQPRKELAHETTGRQ